MKLTVKESTQNPVDYPEKCYCCGKILYSPEVEVEIRGDVFVLCKCCYESYPNYDFN